MSHSAVLKHDLSYYGEDRYDTGANPVFATNTKPVKGTNPFDDDYEFNDDRSASDADLLGGYRPSLSLSDTEPLKTDADRSQIIGKLKRLSSLSKMKIPSVSVPKVLSPRNSWMRMDDDQENTEQKSADEEPDIFETGTSQRTLKKRLSFLGRFGKN